MVEANPRAKVCNDAAAHARLDFTRPHPMLNQTFSNVAFLPSFFLPSAGEASGKLKIENKKYLAAPIEKQSPAIVKNHNSSYIAVVRWGRVMWHCNRLEWLNLRIFESETNLMNMNDVA